MALLEQTVTAAEIAAALEYTPDYFLRIVPDLVSTHGMPSRLPSSRRGHRWSRPAIERWFATYHALPRVDADADDTDPVVARQRKGLHLAYVRPEGSRA